MVDGMKGFKVHGARANREPFCLCGGKSESKKFFITAQDIGKLPIYARVKERERDCGCGCVRVCVCVFYYSDTFVRVCAWLLLQVSFSVSTLRFM